MGAFQPVHVLIGLLAAGVFVTIVVGIICWCWVRLRQSATEQVRTATAFKQTLLDRGYSLDEITQVVRLRPAEDNLGPSDPPNAIADPTIPANLVQILSAVPSEEVDEAVAVYQEADDRTRMAILGALENQFDALEYDEANEELALTTARTILIVARLARKHAPAGPAKVPFDAVREF